MNEPMFSCQNAFCREEVSYPAEMLRLFEGCPICAECYDNLPQEKWPSMDGDPIDFSDLPPFIPEFQAKIERLRAALRKASQIAKANTEQPGDVFSQISKVCREGFGQGAATSPSENPEKE